MHRNWHGHLHVYGTFELDNYYPYALVVREPGEDPSFSSISFNTGDSPGMSQPATLPGIVEWLKVQFQAKMFLVYTPPPSTVGASDDVPVQENTWSWNCSATYPNFVPTATPPAGTPNPIPGSEFSTGFNDFAWDAVLFNVV